jgi:NitT/TauT family transport system substrate-binding protein
MITMNKRLVLAIVTIVAIIIVGGIATTFLYKPAQPSMKIGYIPAASYGLLWIAQENGYFADQGIIVTLKEYANVGQLVAALASGEIDGAPVTSIALAAFVSDLDIRIVAGNSLDGTALVTTNTTDIENLDDLNGKLLGTVQYVPGDFVFMRAITEENVNLTTLEYLTPSDALNALEDSYVNASLLWEPYASLAEYRGHSLSIWDQEIYETDYPCCLQAFSDSYLKANPDAAVKFIKALVKAEVFAYDHTDEALPMVKEYLLGMPLPIVYKSVFYVDPELGRPRNPLSAYFNTTEVARFYALLIGELLTQNDYINLIGKFDITYYNNALAELRMENFTLPERYS